MCEQRNTACLSFFITDMDSNVEYRSVIKFLLLRHTESSEILHQLQEAYGNECPSRATVYNWIRDFKHGRQSVFDAERSGRPCEILSGKRDLCAKIVTEERRISIRELATRLSISYHSTYDMLHSFGLRKLCSRFVPRFLSGEMCDQRLQCCTANLQLFESHGDGFINNIVTQDETPVSLYVPESKRQSSEWCFPQDSAPRKLRSGTSHKRAAMLTVFWDSHGILKVDFLEKGATINSAYYVALLRDVRRSHRKPRGIPLWLLHDNAPIHTSHQTKAAVDDCGFELVSHPPYSPDLAPSDFALFKHLKNELKGHRFESTDVLKEKVLDVLNSLPSIFFKNAFSELVDRWRKCVDVHGSYIEK
jgi:[histone H3]-lysine36 N-dimethyltransferase SETMAR